jgi:class 3 adenylate cyclase
LSSAVNKYLGRLLQIASLHGGDVVKFAGDAVLIVWESSAEAQLGTNVMCATRCAVEMQSNAGIHVIEGTPHVFRIHCGLTCGILESEVFEAPVHMNMQRLFHSVGGETLDDISDLVDLAKPGEVCLSADCVQYLGDRGVFKAVDCSSAKVLSSLSIEPSLDLYLDDHIDSELEARLLRRTSSIEEDFIHPSVLRLLTHGGLSPTHIAQMRNLCVLFIAMTSSGSAVNWLMEVQAVLDRNRCPIVQILDDDKGVHIVAAINLYESVPDSRVLGIEVCRELVEKRVGCAIGMAAGATFCGVTGSNTVACRWDVIGPPAVRAARLMQYALKEGLEIAIDESVYQGHSASVRLAYHASGVHIKGSPNPVSVFSLSSTKEFSAMGLLEVVHGPSHLTQVEFIKEHILGGSSRTAVIVTGPSLAGKKITCQTAAGLADLVPYLHVAAEPLGMLQLARTMASWFKYANDLLIQDLSFEILHHLDMKHWSEAHDETVMLVNTALKRGFSACFVVDRVHALDEFSISLIRECLHAVPRMHRTSSRASRVGKNSVLDKSIEPSLTHGKLAFLCVHVPTYNGKSAAIIVNSLVRSHREFKIPIVEVGQASLDEIRTMVGGMAFKSREEIDAIWLRTCATASGFCTGMFVERIAAITVSQFSLVLFP